MVGKVGRNTLEERRNTYDVLISVLTLAADTIEDTILLESFYGDLPREDADLVQISLGKRHLRVIQQKDVHLV